MLPKSNQKSCRRRTNKKFGARAKWPLDIAEDFCPYPYPVELAIAAYSWSVQCKVSNWLHLLVHVRMNRSTRSLNVLVAISTEEMEVLRQKIYKEHLRKK